MLLQGERDSAATEERRPERDSIEQSPGRVDGPFETLFEDVKAEHVALRALMTHTDAICTDTRHQIDTLRKQCGTLLAEARERDAQCAALEVLCHARYLVASRSTLVP